jgi:hypothetical protein
MYLQYVIGNNSWYFFVVIFLKNSLYLMTNDAEAFLGYFSDCTLVHGRPIDVV